MPTIDNWRALRDALEAGPTDGPFYADGARADLHAVRVKHPTMVGAVFADVGYSGSTKQDTINAEYIAAAHPAAIRSLLDERDRLAAEQHVMREWIAEALPVLASIDDCEDMEPIRALIESGRKLVEGGPDDLLAGA